MTKEQERQKAIKEYRKEATRLVSLANKRIKRLERSNLQSSPAYQKYVAEGEGRFSVKGKSYNELQSEVAKMRGFIDADTSTVRGYNKTLKTMASNTGIKYNNLSDLRTAAPRFFELVSKVEQYLRTAEDMGSALGYQQIWEAVNKYVKQSKINLGSAQANIEEMIVRISDAIAEQGNKVTIPDGDWIKLT